MLKGEKEKADEAFGKNFMESKVTSLSYSLMDYANFWVNQKTNTESAEAMMEMALKIDPERSYFLRTAAQNYVKLGKEDKALNLFGPAYIAKHQDNASDLNSYAWFWAGQGKNLESALEAAKKSVTLQEAYYNWDTLATVYQKMENYPEALKAAEKAYELASESIKMRLKAKIDQIKKAMEKEKE